MEPLSAPKLALLGLALALGGCGSSGAPGAAAQGGGGGAGAKNSGESGAGMVAAGTDASPVAGQAAGSAASSSAGTAGSGGGSGGAKSSQRCMTPVRGTLTATATALEVGGWKNITPASMWELGVWAVMKEEP